MKHTLWKLAVFVAFALVGAFAIPHTTHSYYRAPPPNNTRHCVIFSDTHYFGAHGLNDLKLTYGPNTYYLGDIYDLKNAPRDKVGEVEKAISALREKVGKRYVRGNHELGAFGRGAKDEDYYITDNGVLFTHGHYKISFTDGELAQWETAEAGAGTLKRVGRKLLEGVVEKPAAPKREYLARAVEMVNRHNKAHPLDPCHTIVFGHTHVKKVYAETIDGVRVINVPMGVTELDL
jgi:predicted phosphodiesterase